MKRGSRHGIDLFIEDGAYTTLASAVSILVVLALVFSASGAVWGMSRAGDVQVAADTTALSGANVVASYHTVATVLDASILSLGLAGFAVTGAGLVGLLVPGANIAAGETIKSGIKMLEKRNELAESASKGLEKLEGALPYLIAANATHTCAAQGDGSGAYTGSALAFPKDSASRFPALEGEGIETAGLEETAGDLGLAASELARAREKTASAKRAAWIADCGRDGFNMQERAASLSGLTGRENPDYASSITWEPEAALDRTRAYYRWRADHVEPEGPGVEAAADAAARRALYEYACERFRDAHVEEIDGKVVSTVPLLPRNADDVRATELYTRAMWPTTSEEEGLVAHYGAVCPGATGPTGAAASLASIEQGSVGVCPVCRFDVVDVGKAPAASTSIDNGYEYHLREFTLALDEYVALRNHELELERRARKRANKAAGTFEDAISTLAGKRPRIAPPGRLGCVSFAASDDIASPGALDSAFSPGVSLGKRAAMAGAVCAPDKATGESNVLSQFFSGLEERDGSGGAVGLIDDVMDLWGKILTSYEDLGAGLSALMDDLAGGLDTLGAGPIARWLADRIDGTVRGLGFEPVDLDLRKPVLVDTARIFKAADAGAVGDIQQALRSIPVGSTDPDAVLRALGYRVSDRLAGATFTVATVPLPGGGSIPVTVRLKEFTRRGSRS